LAAGDTQDKTRIQLAGGSKSYQFFWCNDICLAEYESAGWAEPLDEYLDKYWDEYNLGDIPQSLWDAYTFDGKIYGIPSSYNVQCFIYRADVLQEKGLAVPTTYSEWSNVARQLTDKDKGVYGMQFGMKDWDAVTYEFSPFLWGCGGSYYDADWKPIFNSNEGVEALQTLIDLSQYAPPGCITGSNDEKMVMMQQGIALTGCHWATRCGRMDDPENSKVVGLMEFAPIPSKDGQSGHSRVAIDGFMVNKFSDNKETTVRAILDTLTAENEMKAVSLGMVSRASVLSDPDVQSKYRWYKELLESAYTAKKIPGLKENPAIFEKLKEVIHAALQGEMTPKQALDDAAQWTYDLLEEAGYYD
jgi:ABC-type glycerol-3-phosphate transport system substrate-binding protein